MSVSNLRQPVFDNVARHDSGPARFGETSFDFLNRANGDQWERVRGLVQEWSNHVPDDQDYNDLRGRLRSDNAASWSAFLELYLHETFIRAGCRVLIHPELQNTARRPDFLIETPSSSFYLEATMRGLDSTAKGAAQRRADFIDAVNRGKSDHFSLWLEHLVVGSRPARAAHARRLIERELQMLDPNRVLSDARTWPQITWTEDDWSATFRALPLPRGGPPRTDRRLISVYGGSEAEFVDAETPFVAALRSKAGGYGKLDLPLVLAVGTYIFDSDHWHTTNALYGSFSILLEEGQDGSTTQHPYRQGDGFFGTSVEWKNKDVSAILHVNQLQPDHPHRAASALWIHPDAHYPLLDLGVRLPFAVITLDGTQLDVSEPIIESASFFGLPPEWPKDPPSNSGRSAT